MFDVGGRLVLQDDFSGALNAVITGSNRAEQALQELGNAGDASMKTAKQRVAELTREIEQLKTKAKSGGGLTVVDTSRFREASGELKGLKGDMEEITGATKGAGSAMELFGKVSLITGAAFGAMRIATVITDMVKLGAQAQTMSTIFTNLSESAGVSGEKLLADMTRASRGTVDQMTLMTTANRALLAGGADMANKVPQLFEIARAASLATGQDINYVFETLVKGIIKASPLLIDNADIYIKIGAAVDDWAAKQGKVADELSMTERRMAIANAVIDQGGAFMRKMGLDAETASDQVQSMAGATSDLKVALSGLLTEAGGAELIGQLAKNMRSVTGRIEMSRDIAALRDSLKDIGANDALQRLNSDLRQLESDSTNKALALGLTASNADLQKVVDEQAAATSELIDRYEKLFRARQLALTGTHGSMFDDAQMVAPAAADIEDAATAMAAYSAAIGQAASNTTSLSALATQLGQVSGALKALASDVPAVPQIGATLFSVTPTALREYVDAVTAIDPALAEVGASTLAYAQDLEYQQNSLIATAMASDSSRASILALAEATLGAGSGALEMARNFDKLPPSVQAAINPVKLLQMAIADLQMQAGRPITVGVSMQGLDSTLDSIDSMALRLAGVLSPEKVKAFREKARADATGHWQTMGTIDEFGMQLEQKTLLGGYDKIVSGTLDSYKQIENAARHATTSVAASASELTSKVQAALKSGLDVTQLDFDLTAAGKYEPKALEAARQLAAVAERGFAELQAHPDWAGLLKIPPDVLSGSEADLKAWAARTSADVQDLSRPDLINWDAFIANFKAGLDKEAAQKLTVDIAVEKLSAAGLLSGSDADRRQKVAEMLGIAEPKITVDTLFQVGGEAGVARQNLIDQFLGDATALPIPVTPVYTVPANAGGEGDVNALGPKSMAGMVDMSNAIDVGASEKELAASGARVAEIVSKGAADSIDMSDAVAMTASSILLGAKTFEKELMAAGGGVWGKVMAGIDEAVDNSAPDIINRLADKIAPSVAAILARNARRTGGP